MHAWLSSYELVQICVGCQLPIDVELTVRYCKAVIRKHKQKQICRVTVIVLSLLAVLHSSAGLVLCICNHEQPVFKPLPSSSQCSLDQCGQNQLRDFAPNLDVSKPCVDLVVPILTYRSERTSNPLHGVLSRVFETIAITSRPLVPMSVIIANIPGDHHPHDLQRSCSLRSTILNI